MSIGTVYAFYWWDLDIVYVGQTCLPIEHRIKQHLNVLKKGTHYNKRVQEAFSISDNYSVITLDRCSTIELDRLEILWINELNSTSKIYGSNKTFGGGSGGKGVNHARSKYSKNTILKVFSLLFKGFSVQHIINRLKVDKSLIYGIRNKSVHNWLGEQYPKKYALITSREYKELSDKPVTRQVRTSPYPAFRDKEGNIYSGITNLREFCRNNFPNIDSINASQDLGKMLRKKIKTFKGLSLVNE